MKKTYMTDTDNDKSIENMNDDIQNLTKSLANFILKNKFSPSTTLIALFINADTLIDIMLLHLKTKGDNDASFLLFIREKLEEIRNYKDKGE